MPARVVLYFLSWSGFLVSFMMRSDINMALVKMARQTKNATAVNITGAGEAVVIEGEFDWSPMVQSTIIGSFYCCYVLSQVHLPTAICLVRYFTIFIVYIGCRRCGNPVLWYKKCLWMVTICNGILQFRHSISGQLPL